MIEQFLINIHILKTFRGKPVMVKVLEAKMSIETLPAVEIVWVHATILVP